MQNLNGNTALMLLLIEYAQYARSQNTNSNTSIREDTLENYKGIIELLLHHNANVDLQDENGNTALIFISYKETLEIVELLLNNNANVDLQNNSGYTALMSAPFKDKKIVKLLLKHKADINLQEYNTNKTALQIAIQYEKIEAIGEFVMHAISHPEISNSIKESLKSLNEEKVSEVKKYIIKNGIKFALQKNIGLLYLTTSALLNGNSEEDIKSLLDNHSYTGKIISHSRKKIESAFNNVLDQLLPPSPSSNVSAADNPQPLAGYAAQIN